MLAHQIENSNRTKDVVITEDITFESLLLNENVSKGLTKHGFRKPSPIQLKAIPVGRCGFDLIVKSKSGTGKTLVFSIIALESVKVKSKNLQVLILSPTREIAVQSQDVIKQIGCFFEDLQVESFIGGLSLVQDKAKCTNCHIAVGTPGRIKQLVSENILNTDSVRLFILDEADKLMEQNFRNDINEIYNSLPSKKQLITTSATYPNQLNEFMATYMLSPTHVTAEMDTPLLLGLKQFVIVTKPHSTVVQLMKAKNEKLVNILTDISFTQCLIFTNYQNRAESLSNILNRQSWPTTYISGAQTQLQRLTAVNELKEFKSRIMLSTDLTARGIDAANVDLVINYDIPVDATTYLHRMGRAGRYGSSGICINLASDGAELVHLQEILGCIGGTSLNIPKLPKFNGAISELLKTEIPPEECVSSKSVTDPNKLSNVNCKMYETKPDRKPRNAKKQETIKIIETTLIDSKIDTEETDEQESEMDVESTLSSLLNRNFEFGEMADVDETTVDGVDTTTVLEILSENFGAKPDPGDSVQTKIPNLPEKKPDKEELLIKNKALLGVSKILDDSGTPEDQQSIEEHLSLLKANEEELIKNNTSDSSNVLDCSTKTTDTEVSRIGPSEIATEDETLNMENIIQFGYKHLVLSDDDNWKDVLDKMKLTANHDKIETYEDEDHRMEDEDVEIMKWTPVVRVPKRNAKRVAVEDEPEEEVPQSEYDVREGRVVESPDNNEEHEQYNGYFEECSNNLWENGLSFDDVNAFDEWFHDEWETQLHAVRNYVQQNVYVDEMSKYQNTTFNNGGKN